MKLKFASWFSLVALGAAVHAGELTPTHGTAADTATNVSAVRLDGVEQIRAECLQGRRLICGKILKVLPDGLVVESGYTNLLRAPLTRSWLLPGSVTASRAAGLIESREPGAVCVGLVFLTDVPKSRGATRKPKPYDFVILLGYPAGQHTYTSVGTMVKTVRRFSANLLNATRLNSASVENSGTTTSPVVK